MPSFGAGYGAGAYGDEPYRGSVGAAGSVAPPPAPAASVIAVQNVSANSHGAASVVATLGSNVLSGDFLVATFCMPPNVAVTSVTDSEFNRWIQCAYSYGTNNGAELWFARGCKAGHTAVTADFSAAASVSVNVSEWENVTYVDPLDQWSQYFGTSNTLQVQTLQPRATGNLVIVAGATTASVGAPAGGFINLSQTGSTGYASAYQVAVGSVSVSPTWHSTASSPWVTVGATFLAGTGGLNPKLQFPETLVQMCTQSDYLSPLSGVGVWTDISSYVRSMNIGPLGRQHELDRVQATPLQLVANNRDGSFNTWNTASFLYNGGSGLQPMNPIKVTAAWNGITYPKAYGYIQGITPTIQDVLNVDAQVNAVDLLQILSLKYLSSDNYAQVVEADGGTELELFYRLGDSIGDFTVTDTSGNGYTGSLLSGSYGPPIYGIQGPFLDDPSTAADVTGGSNQSNAGFCTIDYTTQPPTNNNPLAGASVWAFECWIQWTGQSALTQGQTITATAATLTNSNVLAFAQGIPTGVAIGDLVAGANIPANTTVTGFYTHPGAILLMSNNATGTSSAEVVTFTAGPNGFTLFSAADTYAASVDGSFDIRVAAGSVGSSVALDSISAGVASVSGYVPIVSTGTVGVQDGNWHYVAVNVASVGSSTECFIYVDGQLEASGAGTGFPNAGANPTSITFGCDAGPVNGWPGNLANIALYSAALTSTQIANHYAIGKWFQQIEIGAAQGDTSAGRFNKVLGVVGLNPEVLLNVPYPFKTELYAETNPITTTSGLNYMQTQTETEPGLIFQGPDGLIYAYNRQFQYLNPTSTTSQAIYGDTAAATVRVEGPALQITGDDLDTWTDIQVQSGRSGSQLQEWGPTQSAIAAQAAAVGGSRTLQGLTSLQQQYDSDALAIAQNYGVWYFNSINRVMQVAINSQGNFGNNISEILSRQLYDQITVQYEGQTPGPTFAQNALVEQVSDTVVMDDPSWSTTFALSPYELLMAPMYLGVWKFGQSASSGVLTL